MYPYYVVYISKIQLLQNWLSVLFSQDIVFLFCLSITVFLKNWEKMNYRHKNFGKFQKFWQNIVKIKFLRIPNTLLETRVIQNHPFKIRDPGMGWSLTAGQIICHGNFEFCRRYSTQPEIEFAKRNFIILVRSLWLHAGFPRIFFLEISERLPWFFKNYFRKIPGQSCQGCLPAGRSGQVFVNALSLWVPGAGR